MLPRYDSHPTRYDVVVPYEGMPLAQLDEMELPAGIQSGVIAYLVDSLGLEDEHSPKIE